MKKFINILLAIFSPLAAVPTGWAIYAGVTEQPAFPMWEPAAIIGAVAIITTSIAAGMLIMDILAYNQGMKNKTEREELSMPVWSAWAILAGCVLAEVTLSLLVVVIPGALSFGVLVFPLMSAAGVFAFTTRVSLQQRAADRERTRAEKKKPQPAAEATAQPAKSRSAKKPTTQPSLSDVPCPHAGAGCARSFLSQNAANAHAGRCKFKPLVAMPAEYAQAKP
jgi:hypothetical protein